MKRKILAALLTSTMVLSLVGCGGGSAETPAAPAADSGAEAEAPAAEEEAPAADSSAEAEAPAADAAAGGGHLTIWTWDPAFNIAAMNEAIAEYSATHEGFTAEVVETSSDDCQAKLINAAESGDYSTLADIILMQDNSFQKYMASYPDAFTDLSDCGINWGDFPELKQSYSMVGDKHFGVPFDNGAVVACYRTDILEQAGHTIDDLTDITWDEFIAVAQDVKDKTGLPLLSSENTGGDLLMMMVQSCGANFVNDNGEAWIEGNATGEACIDAYAKVIQSGAINLVNNWDEYVATITDGKVAGVINGNWITGTIMSASDQSGKWAITNMPKVPGVSTATNYANNGGSSWYISANCQDVALAKDFLATCYTSTDFYDAILPTTGAIACYLPAGESAAYNEPHDFFNGQPIFSQIVGYSGNIPKFPSNPYHYEAREIVNIAVDAIANGADKADTLSQAQSDLEFKMSE